MEAAHLSYYFSYLLWAEKQIEMVSEELYEEDLYNVKKEIKNIANKLNKIIGDQ